MLVEVTDLEATKERIAPILESQAYEYFWRPTSGDDTPPFYAWFIKRNKDGIRTHHIHMVEASFEEHWERLRFRGHLIAHPETAEEYARLKMQLAASHPNDRVAYTEVSPNLLVGSWASQRNTLVCRTHVPRIRSELAANLHGVLSCADGRLCPA